MNTLAHTGLAAWLFVLSATVGAGAWLAIGALTGGAWVQSAAPRLVMLARLTPVAALAGVLLVFAAPILYPAVTGSADPALHGLKAQWMGAPALALRSAIVLVALALLGWTAARRPGMRAAAIWLIVWAVLTTVAAADWILAIDPHFLSTDIGFFFGIVQLAIALAIALVVGIDEPVAQRRGDLGALLLAVSLAILYLSTMQYLVDWSGNLPHKAAWYEARNAGFGTAIRVLAMGLGTVLPFALLLAHRWRRDALWQRVAALSVATGALLHLVWITGGGQ